MSVIDKAIAALIPDETDAARGQARRNAWAAANPGDWLSSVLDHHLEIEAAFNAVTGAHTPTQRRPALRWLAILLTGHVIAEELVLYPALALHDDKGHAERGFTEQATVKIDMAALEQLELMSQTFIAKVSDIRAAVIHHMYEEESTWFLRLHAGLSAADHDNLTHRYIAEFERYVGHDAAA